MITLESVGQVSLVAAPRQGRQHLGYAPGGPQDQWSARWANHVCGNTTDALIVEGSGAALHADTDADVDICLGGAPTHATNSGQPMLRWIRHRWRAGHHLHIPAPWRGHRWYLAIADIIGEIQTSPRHVQHKPCGDFIANQRPAFADLSAWMPTPGTLRMIPGPECTRLSNPDSLIGPWFIDQRSSGMGLRLNGPSLALTNTDLWSSPLSDGTIQAAPNGPIILLRDRPTTGGYPRLATIIAPDISLAAHMRPGERVTLNWVDHDEAAIIEQAYATACAIPFTTSTNESR